jgi:transposase InsO family protein
LHQDSSPQDLRRLQSTDGDPVWFRVQVIQTDNGAEFQSRFHWHLEGLDIRHVYIRARTPRLNGKVERSHRVDDQQFYQLLDKNGISDDIRFVESLILES